MLDSEKRTAGGSIHRGKQERGIIRGQERAPQEVCRKKSQTRSGKEKENDSALKLVAPTENRAAERSAQAPQRGANRHQQQHATYQGYREALRRFQLV